ncbi:ISL3 family transposase [Streptomyces cylindrosporus]|uniref:ISL3 family transposase n=1 Tax=Streptomyces cylindrosporus TaxID=2927583 RepID=A0ABS9YIF5_9ACTN|nr:ISL3 family transposase [Streptomyces cylindrosporus]MCI3277028.1 ISL3 family transposase [Streptomyces cylindrosporus]
MELTVPGLALVTVPVMETDAALWKTLMFDGIDEMAVEKVTAAFGTIDIVASGRAVGAACPDCGHNSARVHGSYQRRLRDLPLGEWSVVILLTVRRFVCDASTCPRRTFVEPFAHLACPYARFTTRLGHLLEIIGLALAGRAGARMAAQLGLGAGRMTLLRRVMSLPDPQFSTPRVIGVDDFATRRGNSYATVITDGERHHPIDVLPGREAAPLTAWLKAHPGADVICRDRAGAYAEAAALGAPGALQVADRFHILQNLNQAVEKCVAAHRDCLRTIVPPVDDQAIVASAAKSETEVDPSVAPMPTGRRAERMRAHHALVHGLLSEGMGLRAIARHLGWGRHTVQRYARADRWQDMVTGRRTRPSRFDVHLSYLQRRIDETDGAITIKDLREELAGRGHRVPYTSLRDWARSRLDWPDAPLTARAAPSVRTVVGWITRHPDTLTEDESTQLKAVLDVCPELDQAHDLVRDFAQMLARRTGADLPDWISAARAAQLPGITGFTHGLTADLEAVIAGLTVHWSSGGTEGAVNRVKKIKRQFYGRAGFELLRKLILLE